MPLIVHNVIDRPTECNEKKTNSTLQIKKVLRIKINVVLRSKTQFSAFKLHLRVFQLCTVDSLRQPPRMILTKYCYSKS